MNAARVPTWRLTVFAAVLLAGACTEGEPETVTPTTAEIVRVERVPGFDTEVIHLGVLVDLSGPDATEHRALLSGAEVAWAEVNSAGGVGGQFPVELVVRDHGGDPDRALEQYRNLREDVVAFALVDGPDVVDAVLLDLAEDGLRAVPGRRLGRWWGREALLTVGTSEEIGVLAVLEYLGTGETWCGVVDTSRAGRAVAEALPMAASLLGLEVPVMFELGGERTIAEVLPLVADAGCRVWLATRVRAAGVFVDGVSEGAVVAVGGRLGGQLDLSETAARVVIAIDAPAWDFTVPSGMVDLSEALEAQAPDVVADVLVREGYTAQLGLMALLEDAVDRGDLSRASVRSGSILYSTADFGGLATGGDPTADAPATMRLFEYDPATGDALGWRFVGAMTPSQAEELLAAIG